MITIVPVDQELVDEAIALLETRLADVEWAGAAAMRLADGTIVTSTAPDTVNESVSLCHETGAICEAFKRGVAVTASVCVVRDPETRAYTVLTPCGVCQERLFLYGGDVEVGVPGTDRLWDSVRLTLVQPYYWRNVLPPD